MRIIHVSTLRNHPCFFDVVSLQAQDHEVTFILLVLSDHPRYSILARYNEEGIRYIHLSVPKDFDFAPDPKLELLFSGLLRMIEPDILHIQLFSGVNARSILRAGSKSPVKKIITLHIHSLFCLPGVCFDKGQVCPLNSLDECACQHCLSAAQSKKLPLSRYNKLREERLKEMVSLAEVIICCSHWQRDTIRRLVGKENKTVVLYYGVTIPRGRDRKPMVTRTEIRAAGIDWKEFTKKITRHGWGKRVNQATIRFLENVPIEKRELQEVLGEDLKKLESVVMSPVKSVRKRSSFPCFGYLGTLVDLKGIDVLLKCVEQNRHLDFQVLMALKFDPTNPGDIAQLEKIKRFPLIRVLPNILRDDLYENFFSQIDYLIIPSVWEETGPMTLFEAFYYKIPVIITDRPSMVEKTTVGVNSLVFVNAEALGGIIKDVIELKVQPAVRTRVNFPVKTFKGYAAALEKIYSAKSPFYFDFHPIFIR